MEVTTGRVASWPSDEHQTSSGKDLAFAQLYQDIIRLQGVLAVVHVFIGVLCMLGNGLVLAVLACYSKLRARLYAPLLASQSLADCLVGVLLWLASMILLTTEQPRSSVGGALYCYIARAGMLYYPFMYASTLNLVAFTLERYVKVVVHTHYPTLVFPASVRLALLIVWGLPLGFTLPVEAYSLVFEAGDCRPSQRWPSVQFELGKGVFDMTVYGFMPVIVITGANLHMLLKIRHHARAMHRATITGDQSSDQHLSAAQLSLAKTLVVVAFFFVLCWLPFQLLKLLRKIGVLTWADTGMASSYLETLMFFNAALNPLIYAVKYAEFRAGLQRMRLWCTARVAPAHTAVTATTAGSSDSTRHTPLEGAPSGQ